MSARRLLGPVLLVLLGVLLSVDHLAWLDAAGVPIARGDSPRHATWALSWANWEVVRPSFLKLGIVFQPTYYPSFVPWLAQFVVLDGGGSGEAYRSFLALFTGLLAVGTGLLGRRLWGDGPGIAAGALTVLVPVLYTLRVEVMLDTPMAAMLVLWLASLPMVPDRPGKAVGSGVLLGLALLTKQTLPYLAGPALAVVGLPALWRALPSDWRRPAGLLAVLGGALGAGALYLSGLGWPAVLLVFMGVVGGTLLAARGGRQVALLRLRDLGVLVAVALLIAGPWYAMSAGSILEGLVVTRADHADVPATLSTAGLLRVASMLVYLVQEMLPWPLALATVVGLVLSPWTARARPLLWPVVAALLGGAVLVSTFPDLHVRHYAPLVGPMAVLAVSPLSLLPLPSLRVSVGGAITLFALVAAGSWRVPELVSEDRRAGVADAETPQWVVAMSGRDLRGMASRLPANPRLFAMLPPSLTLPVDQAVRAIAADHAALREAGQVTPGQRAMMVSQDPSMEPDGLLMVSTELGLDELFAVEGKGDTQVRQLPPEVASVYAVDIVDDSVGLFSGGKSRVKGRYRPSLSLMRAGFEEIARFDVDLGEQGAPEGADLVVYRWTRADPP